MVESENAENEKTAAPHVHDAKTLSRTDLKRKYQLTYNSWRNSKHRAKMEGNWSSAFDEFANFLIIMGPRPDADHTLDRIDNKNSEYAPNLCRWLDKRGQANNRSSTILLDIQGNKKPLSEYAREQNLDPRPIRQALREQTSIAEALPDFGRDPRQYKPWPPQSALRWEERFLVNGGIRKTTRYRFIIFQIKSWLAEEGDWLMDNCVDPTTELLPECEERNASYGVASRLYDKLCREQPEWEKAKRAYTLARDAKEYERRYLNQRQPPDHEEENDE